MEPTANGWGVRFGFWPCAIAFSCRCVIVTPCHHSAYARMLATQGNPCAVRWLCACGAGGGWQRCLVDAPNCRPFRCFERNSLLRLTDAAT